MRVREHSDRFKRLIRSALGDLFDQRSPFGRLALTHVLMTAGDTLFAVSLAGSLFFSISPTAAKDKVVLYLLLTMAPFALVAPALGPLIDRSRGARRAMVVASALGRAVLCPLVAFNIHSVLLFPLAFLMLVLSKVYLVTKGALVPEMAALGLIGERPATGPDAAAPTTAGAADAPVPAPDRRAGPHAAAHPTPPHGTVPVGGTGDRAAPPYATPPYATPPYATPPYATPPYATPPYGTPLVRIADPVTGVAKDEPDLATLNARLGLLASLAATAAAIPAVVLLKVGGAPFVLWADVVVFAVGVVAGLRLPVRGMARRLRERGLRPGVATTGADAVPAPVLAPDVADDWLADAQDLAALRSLADGEVGRALLPMSTLKVLIGFLTFLVAFGLRREDAATWWFGFILGGLTVGALVGVLLVARIRRRLSEQQILAAALWLVAAVAAVAALFPSRWIQALVAMAVGMAGAIAKPSFDALVQRHVREEDQGRAFARFETQFQLMWVLGSFAPVVLTLPLQAGNAVMALLAAVVAVSYPLARRSAEARGARPLGPPTPFTGGSARPGLGSLP